MSDPSPDPALEAEYRRLRTEWLRFRSHLYDSATELPTLAAVLEDVRRIVETCGVAEVFHLDLGGSGWHEAKAGWAAYDAAVASLAAALLAARDAGALGARAVVCLQYVRSDRFLVFRDGPRDGGAGIAERAAALVALLRERMFAEPAGSLLRTLRIVSGFSRIRLDPMVRSERAILQRVSEAMYRSLHAREDTDASRRDELVQLIARGAVRTVFHSIVRLSDREVVGHEALTRPVGACSFHSVEDLFSYAESTDLGLDFERLCRVTAILSYPKRGRSGLLFLNSSAQAVRDPEWSAGGLTELLARSGLTPHDIVIEITERVAVGRDLEFRTALHQLKQRGYRIAVDDMGAGHSSLQALAAVEPDFLKFDVSLVREIDRSGIKRSLLESLHVLSQKIGARVIAEGVERREEMETLRQLGIELAQGFYLSAHE